MTSRFFRFFLDFTLLLGALLVGAVDAKAQSSPDSCLESLASTGCMLRWEVDASAVTGSSSQSGSSTTPNLLFKLDFQAVSPKDSRLTHPLSRGTPRQTAGDRFAAHLLFKTGYTQVPLATRTVPIGGPGGAASQCPGSPAPATAPVSTCTVAAAQRAFVADAALRIGWTFGRNGQGAFSEIGLTGRGGFEDIVPANQVIQSGGLSYADLSSANLNNIAGLYEATFHYRLGQLGHNTPAAANGKYGNVSDLLVIEAGFQVNTGLAQLDPANPQMNTRNRFVGRFYAYPELPGSTHTKILVGVEYSGGVNGGPQIIQLIWGTSLNMATLIKPGK